MSKKYFPVIIVGLLFVSSSVYALATYKSIQVGGSAANGYILQTNGTDSTWVATSTLGITGMVYPDAGIPLSTGTAWDTSITNNSANWNTAYGWGNHAGLYESVLTFNYPLTRATNAISLAFGTTTANSWSALQTFTNASTTNIGSTGSAYFATSGGNVGIGTTSPGYKLSIETSDITIAQFGSTAGLFITANNPSFRFNSYYTGGSKYHTAGYAGQWQFAPSTGDMILYNTAASGVANGVVTWQEVLRADKSGKVGIGTTTPGSTLSVRGGGYFDGGTLIAQSIQATSTMMCPVSATLAAMTSAGQIGMDSTSGQFHWYDGIKTQIITGTSSLAFNLASTTMTQSTSGFGFATSTYLLKNIPEAIQLNRVFCKATSTVATTDILLYQFVDGVGNYTNTGTCDTTGVSTLITTNNTWTVDEDFNIVASSTAGNIDRATFTLTTQLTDN